MFGSLITGKQDYSSIFDQLQQIVDEHEDTPAEDKFDPLDYSPISLDRFGKDDLFKDIQGERVPTPGEQQVFQKLSVEMSKLIDKKWDIPPKCRKS